MAVKTWTLTDAPSSSGEMTIEPKDVGGAASGYKISQRTLRGGLSEGVEVVRVDNGAFSFEVLPTRGMNLWKAWAKGLELGWKSPVRGPVHPQYVDMGEPSGLGWLDGFDELLVRCGLESNGAPEHDENGKLLYPLHGRIGNRPAHKVTVSVDGDSGEISVTGVVEETRFHFLKVRMTSTVSTKVGENGLRIHDEVENLSASPAEIQMLYHVNFGLPLLDGGSKVAAPVKTVVPRNAHAAGGIKTWDSYGAEEPGFEEQVYFMELLADDNGQTQTLLKNAHGTQGVSLHFNKKQLPVYTVWKNTTAGEDGYVTGLEPGTNFPNPRTYEGEQGRVTKIDGRGKVAFDLELRAHPTAADVEKAEKAVAALQGDVEPKVFDEPQDGWCAP